MSERRGPAVTTGPGRDEAHRTSAGRAAHRGAEVACDARDDRLPLHVGACELVLGGWHPTEPIRHRGPLFRDRAGDLCHEREQRTIHRHDAIAGDHQPRSRAQRRHVELCAAVDDAELHHVVAAGVRQQPGEVHQQVERKPLRSAERRGAEVESEHVGGLESQAMREGEALARRQSMSGVRTEQERVCRPSLDAPPSRGHCSASTFDQYLMIRKKRLPLLHLALFGWLPSPIKVWAYRIFRGYRIGKGVKLAFGGVIVGTDVEIGDNVEIGLLAMVMGRTIRIGRFSSVGTMSYVSCERIDIGEDARIREQVFVGGPQLPESSFTLGSRTIILQLTSINPTKPVTIGDDTGIGGHCLIFTHGAWLNAMDGYPATYAPVTIGNSVWLPWRVFVMPGTTIGDGSVIGANSLVQGTIPAGSLAVGSPAKVIKSAPDFPKVPTDDERKALVAEIVSEFDRTMMYEGVQMDVRDDARVYSMNGSVWRLSWRRKYGVPLTGLTKKEVDRSIAQVSVARP